MVKMAPWVIVLTALLALVFCDDPSFNATKLDGYTTISRSILGDASSSTLGLVASSILEVVALTTLGVGIMAVSLGRNCFTFAVGLLVCNFGVVDLFL